MGHGGLSGRSKVGLVLVRLLYIEMDFRILMETRRRLGSRKLFSMLVSRFESGLTTLQECRRLAFVWVLRVFAWRPLRLLFRQSVVSGLVSVTVR